VNITEEKVRYVADLANLTLSEDEIHKFAHDLSEILTHVETLNEVDTKDVPPMAQVLFEAEETATLRPDVVRPPLGTAVALANAPLAGSGYFKVPRVIER
jgi:aspartyl-tRNA(Asn)/glutamyl-tRNA(Gln) amidotransferase subunit C